MTSDHDLLGDPHAALRARVARMEHELHRLAAPADLRHQLANAVASPSMTLALLDQSLPSDLRARLEGMLRLEAARAAVLDAAVQPRSTSPRGGPGSGSGSGSEVPEREDQGRWPTYEGAPSLEP